MATVGRGADQYTVRFPDGLRDQIKAAAEANGRSMNAEIVARLTESLERERLLNTPMPGGGLFGLRPKSPEISEIASEVVRLLMEQTKKDRDGGDG